MASIEEYQALLDAHVANGLHLAGEFRQLASGLAVPAPVAPVALQPLVWPVGDTVEADCIFTDGFWVQRTPTYNHEGRDLRARDGKPILAMASGVVCMASLWDGTLKRFQNYGNFVLQALDGSDYVALYAHMKELRVQGGQRVAQGQVLGLAGATGNTKNAQGIPLAHLHLHLLHPTGRLAIFGQRVVDPGPLLPPAGQRSHVG